VRSVGRTNLEVGEVLERGEWHHSPAAAPKGAVVRALVAHRVPHESGLDERQLVHVLDVALAAATSLGAAEQRAIARLRRCG